MVPQVLIVIFLCCSQITHGFEILNSRAARSKFQNPRDNRCRVVAASSREPSDIEDAEESSPPPSALQLRLAEEERRNRLRQAKQQLIKQKQAQSAMDLPPQPLVRTLSGGTNLIFAMAKQWKREAEEAALSMAGARGGNQTDVNREVAGGIATATVASKKDAPTKTTARYTGMTSREYAATIWRNVRKKKPSLWRYALRSYNRMASSTNPKLRRTNIHHTGALVACSKLGDWEAAFEIFRYVQQQEDRTAARASKVPASAQRRSSLGLVHVTDHMILSVIRGCVQASRKLNRQQPKDSDDTVPMSERRAPLDAAVRIIEEEIPERYPYLPVVARHVNPLASAYQALGLVPEAAALIERNLKNRTTGPEAELPTDNVLNVQDIGAKDKGSYALLVQGAVSTGDWGAAVDSLRDMTEAGLFPKERHLHRWTEGSEKHSSKNSWKKKRTRSWVAKVQE